MLPAVDDNSQQMPDHAPHFFTAFFSRDVHITLTSQPHFHHPEEFVRSSWKLMGLLSESLWHSMVKIPEPGN